MDSTDWEPLGDRTSGMVAVTIAALISFLSISLLMALCLELLYKHYRTSSSEQPKGGESRAIRFLTSDYFLATSNMMLGDLIQSCGFSLNIMWITRGKIPTTTSTSCKIQSILIQVGDTTTAFGSLLIGIQITQILAFGHQMSRSTLLLCFLLQWVCVGLLASIGPAFMQTPGRPFYGWSGGWCWITQEYQTMRLWLHYLLIFVVAATNLLQYSLVFIRLWRSRPSKGGTSSAASVAKLILLYPLIYILTILPLSTVRLAGLAGHPWPVQAQIWAGAVFMLNGFANCCLYVFTRKILNVETESTPTHSPSSVLRVRDINIGRPKPKLQEDTPPGFVLVDADGRQTQASSNSTWKTINTTPTPTLTNPTTTTTTTIIDVTLPASLRLGVVPPSRRLAAVTKEAGYDDDEGEVGDGELELTRTRTAGTTTTTTGFTLAGLGLELSEFPLPPLPQPGSEEWVPSPTSTNPANSSTVTVEGVGGGPTSSARSRSRSRSWSRSREGQVNSIITFTAGGVVFDGIGGGGGGDGGEDGGFGSTVGVVDESCSDVRRCGRCRVDIDQHHHGHVSRRVDDMF